MGLKSLDEPLQAVENEVYIAVDATCPKCGWAERRARFDEHGAIFSCRKCTYVSRRRNA